MCGATKNELWRACQLNSCLRSAALLHSLGRLHTSIYTPHLHVHTQGYTRHIYMNNTFTTLSQTNICIHTKNIHLHMYMHMYAYMHEYTHTHTYIYAHIHTYVDAHKHMRIKRMHRFTPLACYICTCTYTHTHARESKCIRLHSYTLVHTHTPLHL